VEDSHDRRRERDTVKIKRKHSLDCDTGSRQYIYKLTITVAVGNRVSRLPLNYCQSLGENASICGDASHDFRCWRCCYTDRGVYLQSGLCNLETSFETRFQTRERICGNRDQCRFPSLWRSGNNHVWRCQHQEHRQTVRLLPPVPQPATMDIYECSNSGVRCGHSRYRKAIVTTAAAPSGPSYLTAGNRDTASKRRPGSQLYARHAVGRTEASHRQGPVAASRTQSAFNNSQTLCVPSRSLVCSLVCSLVSTAARSAVSSGAGSEMRDCRSHHSYRRCPSFR
jgi:hypothetical protein